MIEFKFSSAAVMCDVFQQADPFQSDIGHRFIESGKMPVWLGDRTRALLGA